jgi:hypothetical protein
VSLGKKYSVLSRLKSSQGRTKISCTGTTSPTNQSRKNPFHTYSLSPHLHQFQQLAGATPLSSLSVGKQALWWEGEHLAMIPKISSPVFFCFLSKCFYYTNNLCGQPSRGAEKNSQRITFSFLYFYFDAKNISLSYLANFF